MIGYIRAHWHGELSLAQSYWLNVICLDLVLDRGMTLLERPIERQGIEKGAVIGLSLLVLLAVIWAWQSVGVWRSATNTSTRTGRAFWPRVAKVVTVLGIAAGTVGVVAGVWDITRSLAAIRDPDLAEYTIERVGDTDLVFTGAINDESVDDIIMALEGSPIEILRVNSLGGLMPPAMRLARHIRENQLMVMAEEECSSACVMLLAASPQAAIWPGTTVTFHRPEPVVEPIIPEFGSERLRYVREAAEIYREMGVADWAIETAGRQQYWTPTVDQQIRMNLIVFIYDIDQNDFVPARVYCDTHPTECA